MLTGTNPKLRQLEPCQLASVEQCSSAHLGLVLPQCKGSSEANGIRGRNVGQRRASEDCLSLLQGGEMLHLDSACHHIFWNYWNAAEFAGRLKRQRQRLRYAATKKLPDKTAANMVSYSSLWGHGQWETLMTNAARRNDLQQAEMGEELSASSARRKNATSDGRQAHLAERAFGTSLPSSRTMPASILDSPRNQTSSSAMQSIPPTGGNLLRQQSVGRVGG